ncbi:MAG: hypothetical protein WCG14_06590 [Chlamydiia bacterium]
MPSDIKNTIYVSQYIGDIGSVTTYQSYHNTVWQWNHLLTVLPEQGVCDTHPDMLTHHCIKKNYKNRSALQHHRAYVLSALIETSVASQCLAIVWNGTGIGDDLSIWGEEAFMADKNRICQALDMGC